MSPSAPRPPYIALCLLALVHSALTLAYALTRIYSYKASLLDIGLFDQLLWNLQQHGIPVTTATLPFTPQHWLGFHFSPLLFALLPLYALWPHMEMLQIVQSLCFGFAALPLFLALRALGASTLLTWVFTLAYWANPLILSAAIWDFHEIAFSTVCISLALYALLAQRFALMLCALVLLLLTKEHYGVAVAGFGFLWGWHYRDWKRASLLMGTGVIVTYGVITILMPYFGGGAHPMFSDEGTVVSRYGWLFGTWHERWGHLLGLILGDGLSHIMLLVLSGLVFVVFAPFYLAPAAADILANLLSANPMPRHIASYHAAACVPVLLVAGLQGLLFIQKQLPRLQKLLQAAVVIFAAIFPVTGLTLLPFSLWELTAITPHPERQPIQDIMALTGNAPLVVQANVGMFFAQRSHVYPYPHMLTSSDYVLLHLHRPFADVTRSNFNIPFGTDTQSFAASVTALTENPDWHIAYWQAPWLLLKRGVAESDESIERQQVHRAIKALTLP